jgi:hypothetical protein
VVVSIMCPMSEERWRKLNERKIEGVYKEMTYG